MLVFFASGGMSFNDKSSVDYVRCGRGQ